MTTASPFNFCEAIQSLCDDVSVRLEEFQHIRMEEVFVAFAQTRSRVQHGLQAKLTPMRFEEGSLFTMREGQKWTVQRMFQKEIEMLYILTFYLPRFQNQTFREKMITVLHELYHISPQFDGDIRRFPGHCHVHTHSQKEYDRQMGLLVDKYLSLKPPQELYQFLRKPFRQLEQLYGGIIGQQAPIPRLIPVSDARSA
ncbi:hypothetical protein MNBD_PLANCTO02-979 [hydrothermal vent metagenome]|uniref:Putative phage metallopeptidase domain-containing protein n=1 Tax=hydrothermal vent metagenome TaxID=652676 RepID=A0A3B1E600_9ZZZZ